MVADVCARLGPLNGILGSQRVTVGYDFRRDMTGTIVPAVARMKLDVSCQFLTPSEKAQVLPLAAELAEFMGLRRGGLHTFAKDLVSCFGGFDPEFVSAGLTKHPVSTTIYVKPHGYAQA